MAKNSFTMKKNLLGIFFFLLAVFVVFICGLGYRTIVQGSELQAKAESIRTRSVTVAAARGIIYDRNGNKLAVSLSADSIAANPAEVLESGEADSTAAFLAETLGMEKEEVYEKITKSSSFEWIKRKADFDAAEKIAEADLPGIEIVEETQRFYPKNELAANILGFAGIDNQGLEGIEYSYDDILKGKDGSIVTEYDAKNNSIPQATQQYNPPEDGKNIVLTIDENIQYFAERELDNMMASEISPKACAILAMDPNTGEILAMASRPTYDPNNYQESEAEDRRNMLVSDTYEPGSTFKIITSSAALDSGAATVNSRFYDPGYAQIGSRKLRCWRYYNPHGSQSFSEIMQNSCNPGFVKLMQMMEEKEEGLFYQYIRDFGFGETTGLGLKGEAKGIVIDEEDVTIQDLASISIGQSIAVTPLQLVTAVSAVANGGTLLQPQIIRQITDAEGNVVQDFETKEVRRVISEEVSDTICSYLENVVAKGTGKSAYIEGFRVGGKSGTAQKAGEGGYQDGKYVASFCAMAPTNDPQIVMLAIVDEPQGALYQGGQVAAPMLKKVLEDTLRYMGVVSQVTELDEERADESDIKEVAVPDVKNLTVEEAKKVITLAGLTYEISGSGDVVNSQTPAGFSRVQSGTKVILKTAASADADGQLIVPDLTGKYVREAAEILNAMGLKLKTTGTGVAMEIDPIPGTKVKRGDVISIKFEPEDVTTTAVEPN